MQKCPLIHSENWNLENVASGIRNEIGILVVTSDTNYGNYEPWANGIVITNIGMSMYIQTILGLIFIYYQITSLN